MKVEVFRPAVPGVLILLLSGFIFLAAFETGWMNPTLRQLLGYSPAIGGLLTAFLAPRSKVSLGASIGVASAALGVFFDALYHALGIPTDIPLLEGFLLRLILNTAYAFVGALIGFLIAFALKGNGNQQTT